MNTLRLTKSERLTIIRFCLNRGTHIKCSTHSLLRPLEMQFLEKAFAEREAEHDKEAAEISRVLSDYKNGKPLSEPLRGHLEMLYGKKPTKKQIEEFFSRALKDLPQIRASYGVSVDYEYLSEDVLAFHNSMNPKITFGYSNQLHEECDSEITDAVRNMLLPCFKDSKDIEVFLTFGAFAVGKTTDEFSPTYYEDLIILRGGKELLSTITHEEIFDLVFDDEDIKAFGLFENSVERNEKIISKLRKTSRAAE